MVSIAKKGGTAATRSQGDEEDGIRGAKTKAMGIELDEKRAAMVSRMMETENIKEMATKNAKERKKENIEETEMEVKEKETTDTILTSSGAAEAEGEPGVEVLKYARREYYSI